MNIEYTVIFIKSIAIKKKIVGKIINRFEENDFVIIKYVMCRFNDDDIVFLNNFCINFNDYDLKNEFLLIVLQGYNLIYKINIILGLYDENFESSINNYFINLSDYIFHCSKNIEDSKKLINYFFDRNFYEIY